jgi:electron transfer flavoprotein alpha subunit
MNNIFVYLEIEEGIVGDVSLELLTKGRTLANQLKCKLEAVAAGYKLESVGTQVWMYSTLLTTNEWLLTLQCLTPHY